MISGRLGHARVVVLSVIPEEWTSALEEFRCAEAACEVEETGVYAPLPLHSLERLPNGLPNLPFVVTRTTDRSNLPAMESTRRLLELWRPEFVVLCGIAGGVRRLNAQSAVLEGPDLGDVVIGEYIHYADYGKDLPGKFVPRYFPLAHPTPSLVRRHTDWLKLGGWAHDMLKPGSGTSPTIFHGEIVAVEAVAGNPGSMRQQGWIKHFDKALAVEMESGGVARAIHDTDSVHYNPRWFVIRGISDSVVGGAAAAKLLSRSNQEERNHWHEYAAQVAARVTRLLTQRLVKSPRLAHPEQPGSPAWSTGGGAP